MAKRVFRVNSGLKYLGSEYVGVGGRSDRGCKEGMTGKEGLMLACEVARDEKKVDVH